MSEQLDVELDETTTQRLEALGRLREQPATHLAQKAIARYLDEEERYEREKREDMARWEEYKRTGRSIPNEQVMAWLNEMVTQGRYVPWGE
jgi:predicted transcriptional regulator